MNTSISTSTLTGADLDYWVGRAQGFAVAVGVAPADHAPRCYMAHPTGAPDFAHPYWPSLEWTLCGPIMEQHDIELTQDSVSRAWTGMCPASRGGMTAYRLRLKEQGPTQKVAAMRAYVSASFGATVGAPPAWPPVQVPAPTAGTP